MICPPVLSLVLRQYTALAQLKPASGRRAAHYGRTPPLVLKARAWWFPSQSPGQVRRAGERQQGRGVPTFQGFLGTNPRDYC